MKLSLKADAEIDLPNVGKVVHDGLEIAKKATDAVVTEVVRAVRHITAPPPEKKPAK